MTWTPRSIIAHAVTRHVRVSAQKTRLVADQVRDRFVGEALTILRFRPEEEARPGHREDPALGHRQRPAEVARPRRRHPGRGQDPHRPGAVLEADPAGAHGPGLPDPQADQPRPRLPRRTERKISHGTENASARFPAGVQQAVELPLVRPGPGIRPPDPRRPEDEEGRQGKILPRRHRRSGHRAGRAQGPGHRPHRPAGHHHRPRRQGDREPEDTSWRGIAKKEVYVDIREIEKPELNSLLVAEGIAVQLEKRIAYRRAMRKAVESALRQGAKGIKVMCAGRLGGVEIARTEWYLRGQLPAADAQGRHRLRLHRGLHHLRPDRHQGLDLQGRRGKGQDDVADGGG